MTNNVKIPIRKLDLGRQIENIKKWRISEEDKKYVPQFFRDFQIGKITGNQPTEGTLISYLADLRVSLEYWNKSTSKLTIKNTEDLSEAFLRNTLNWGFKKRTKKGETIITNQPYSETGKIKIKNTTILYLNWRLGEDKAAKLVKILKVRPHLKQKSPDYLTEDQVEKLYKSTKSAKERYLISLLYDGGMRAEEFCNIRFSDIQLPNGSDNFVKLTLKEEYSKTKGRTIGLYWKYSYEAVRDYLNERISEGIKEDEPIFVDDYNNTLKFLKRLGKRILGRKIYFHLFRHSSATYYANKLNRQELCIRYGWNFCSPCPDIYISRDFSKNGIDEKFEKTQISELRIELEKQKQFNTIKQDELERKNQELQITIQNLALNTDNIVRELKNYIFRLLNLNTTENY
ncbi:MAG TPA: site-specific integrase [Candidatus Nanoarchaeia archaeon]|nr:site-specific integrase [Candidatus Nanoarchaeia archaeon]